MLLLPAIGAQTKNEPPRVHDIKAVLEPPFTHYSVEAIDPELATLTYSWTLTGSGRCTGLTADGATASWRHDDEERCPHEAAAHPGTITVVVSDGTSSVTRTYAGGSAAHDPGQPDWRTTGTSFFGGNEEGDDPRDFPPPAIYGEELDCPARNVVGNFEPVQAVWQDEDTGIFPEEPGRRFVKGAGGSGGVAELPLVVGKLTQLFGLREDHSAIYYNGTLTGSERVAAVVRWTIKDAAGERVLGEIDVGDLYLGGDRCAAPSPFNLKFDTSMGLKIRHFLPKAAGPYSITMELAERGGAGVPGSEVIVTGTAKKVHEPRVYFVGTILRPGPAEGSLASAAREFATSSSQNIPDLFPLPPGGFHTYYRPTDRNLSRIAATASARCGLNATAYNACFEEAMRTGVESLFGGGAWQLRSSRGETLSVDRIAIVISQGDMDHIYPPANSANGFASNTKTFWVHSGTSHLTVAHEFTHTTPTFVYLDGADCTIDYHNDGGSRGHGFQLSLRGQPVRIPKAPMHGLMQGGFPSRWIEQCTYEHILNSLDSLGDPRLVGVRGWIVSDGASLYAEFEPGMTFEGIPDAAPGGTGRFALRLLDAAGGVLAEHRFDHPFRDDNGRERRMVAFNVAIERPDGLARIELADGSGVLASRIVTPNAPTLTLDAPAADVAPAPGQPLRVAWRATDPDGDALTYGVVYSPDDGGTWYDVDFDLDATSIDVPAEFLALGSKHVVRVMATDGVNSVEVERPLGPRAPPTATGPGAIPTEDPTEAPGEGEAGAPGPAIALVLAAVGAAWVIRRRA